MMNVSIERPAPTPPPAIVTITLDEDKALELMALLGMFGTELPLADLFHPLCETLFADDEARWNDQRYVRMKAVARSAIKERARLGL